jgi:hypothetical protein
VARAKCGVLETDCSRTALFRISNSEQTKFEFSHTVVSEASRYAACSALTGQIGRRPRLASTHLDPHGASRPGRREPVRTSRRTRVTAPHPAPIPCPALPAPCPARGACQPVSSLASTRQPVKVLSACPTSAHRGGLEPAMLLHGAGRAPRRPPAILRRCCMPAGREALQPAMLACCCARAALMKMLHGEASMCRSGRTRRCSWMASSTARDGSPRRSASTCDSTFEASMCAEALAMP